MNNIIGFLYFIDEDGKPGLGCCGWLLTVISWALVGFTFPLSLCVCVKVCYFTCITKRPTIMLSWTPILIPGITLSLILYKIITTVQY